MSRRIGWKLAAAMSLMTIAMHGCKREAESESKEVDGPARPPAEKTVDAAIQPRKTEAPESAAATGKERPTPPVHGSAHQKTISGIVFDVPVNWTEQKVSSTMRKAQWELPGEAGAAELIVYYFGKNGAGGREANVKRWVGQFSNADNPTAGVSWESDTVTQNKLTHTIVKVRGTYSPLSMRPNAPAPTPRSDYAMYGVILEDGPEGPLYVKAVGPRTTIGAHSEALDAFGRSARAVE
ncbi:MAG: hypothetical protein MI923_04590 [Phycisphaerales bacterium]|nr:hypothetical protein [Phycisphaerales bacterium]